MEELFFDIAYIFIFTLLGLFTLFTLVPKNDEFKNYLRARKVLAGSFFMMAGYCILRLFIESSYNYSNVWSLLTFSMGFTWLQYTSLMLILNSAKFKIRHIFVDGIVPVIIMLVLGMTGYIADILKQGIVILMIIIYSVKSSYMFYVCVKEYRRCAKEIDNYYDDILDISWIKKLILLSLLMSMGLVATIIFPPVHKVFDVLSPIVFI